MDQISKVKQIYVNGYAKTFKNDYRLSKVIKLAKKLRSGTHSRMLDVGCGEGSFSLELGKALGVSEIFGVDISPHAVGEATSRNIHAIALDIDETDFPFKTESFDFIFCGNLIELVLDPDHLIEELYRVLSRKGCLIMTFPNICAWASRIAVLFGFHPYYDRISRRYDFGKMFIPLSEGNSTGFIRLFGVASFRRFLKLYKLKAIKFYGARGNLLPKFLGPVDFLFSLMPQFAFQVICIIRKA